ncbi:MAG: pyridoxamine 5'-phosphate oxidase family protein [Nitrospira sp.]|nr:pyridoxamine 5'-phosphate oxidase family protein [Nitrospira sp.]
MSMPDTKSNDDLEAAWRTLAEQTRTGVLLTLRNGHPFGSHVPFLLAVDWSRVYLHLSRLALHTQHLLEDARVSLFLAEPDKPGKNPLARQRINLQGTASILLPTEMAYESVKQRYLAKFPQSHMMFDFSDFALWELRMENAHLVLGFGQAYQACSTTPGQWQHQKPDKKS